MQLLRLVTDQAGCRRTPAGGTRIEGFQCHVVATVKEWHFAIR